MRDEGGPGVAVDVRELYLSYGPMVLRRCRRLLRDEALARDAMQDTFVDILGAADRLQRTAPSGLLFRTATNVCLNKLRSMKREPVDPDDALLYQIACCDRSEERLSAALILEKIFRKEPESTRVIAVLHLLDGMTYEEVAREVGMSVSGVRKRLRLLKARIQKLHKGEDDASGTHHS